MNLSRRVPIAAVLALLAAPAAAQDWPGEDEARNGVLLVAGFDLGSYGIGSGVAGPSLGLKLGAGLRRESLAVALVAEADYGVVSQPLRGANGNTWVLPQLDLAYLDGNGRVHAFLGVGSGRFVVGPGSERQTHTIFGGGVGFGYSAFEATIRYLAADTQLVSTGRGAGPVPGVGAQLTLGMRFDVLL